MGVSHFEFKHTEATLAPGDEIRFAATGVTDGELLKGITYWGSGCRTHSLVMGLDQPRRVRFVDTVHVEDESDQEVRI